MTPAIDIRNLSKRFKIYPRPRARLIEWLSFGSVACHSDFWALHDFSLQVQSGECIGIVGPNGAGKSTLLKLLSKTLSPTSGSFAIKGKVLSLLELGTGFKSELTGRQNVIETSSLLGFPDGYVNERMKDILAFSSLGEFFDRPLKIYSSGMTVRLAFSMFVFLKPDVFIIDEALAVGDVGFQRACYKKIEQMLAAGVTCLMVTHDLNAIVRFCHRAVMIDRGKKVFEGEPREAANRLNDLFFGLAARNAAEETSGDGTASIDDIWFEDIAGHRIASSRAHEAVQFCFDVTFHKAQKEVDFGFHIKTVYGVEVTTAGSEKHTCGFGPYEKNETVIVRWTLDLNLNAGSFFFGCGVRYHQTNTFMCRRADAIRFPISDLRTVGGIINPVRSVTVESQKASGHLMEYDQAAIDG